MHLPTIAVAISLFATCAVSDQTKFNSDVVQGIPVITKLDLNDVPINAITRYYFLAGEAQGPIKYHVPVFVARGSKESLENGKRLSLSAAVHGDEYTGVRVIQKVFAEIEHDVKSGKLNGTIIGVPTINMNGIMHNQRNFYSSGENGFLTNLNRLFPGKDPEDAKLRATLPEGYAYRIWNGLWGNTSNVDVAVDMHTLTFGSDGPLWVYSDYRQPYNERLATLAQPDIIKIDPGEPGTIETAFVETGIPAITLELGGPVSWTSEYITRGYDFVIRLIHDLKILPPNDANDIVPDLSKTYIATNRVNLATTKAGWAEALVKVLDDVKEGQEVVLVRNTFGDVVDRVRAPADSRVLQVRTNPPVEPGSTVLVLVNNSTSS